jgi:release factor glutamine methyltransferase
MPSAPVTLGELTTELEARFAVAGVDSPRLSAQLLAAHALGWERFRVVLEREMPLEAGTVRAIRELGARREAGEPVDKIVGVREFYGRDFAVSSDVLSPRPETEGLVEAALDFLGNRAATVADLGTGSGCVGVTMAAECAALGVVGVELSAAALPLARANSARHGVAERVQLVRADFGLPLFRPGSLACVVANPPYLTEAELREVSREVRDHDPSCALVAGPQGTEAIRSVAACAAAALAPGGAVFVEIGCNQGPAAANILTGTGFFDVYIERDLSGLDRIACGRKG